VEFGLDQNDISSWRQAVGRKLAEEDIHTLNKRLSEEILFHKKVIGLLDQAIRFRVILVVLDLATCRAGLKNAANQCHRRKTKGFVQITLEVKQPAAAFLVAVGAVIRVYIVGVRGSGKWDSGGGPEKGGSEDRGEGKAREEHIVGKKGRI